MDLQMDAQNLVQKLRIQAGQLEFNLSLLYAQKQAEEEYNNTNHLNYLLLKYIRNGASLILFTFILSIFLIIIYLTVSLSLTFIFANEYLQHNISNFINTISTFPLELQVFLIVLALLVILGYYIQQKALQKQILKKAKREQLIKIGEDTLQEIRMLLINYDQGRNY